MSQVGVGALCAQLSDSPKSMEQRARRAVERGLTHLASLGVEDYGNEVFTQYASRLFPFQEVRAEMAYLQGKGQKGKANLKRFWTACWCWQRRTEPCGRYIRDE